MNSKRIGNDYEREVSRTLSKWLTGSEEELVVWRNKHSGTVSTVREKKGLSGKHTSGDIECLDSAYEDFFKNFHVDSKSLKSVHLCLINPKNQNSSQLAIEWAKVYEDALRVGKIPMMMVKARNDRKIPEFIVFPDRITFRCLNFMHVEYQHKGVHYWVQIVLQKEFFEMNHYEHFLWNNQKSM